MFEIKFVQHLNPFYQVGKFYVYSMSCELYQYSSEQFNTGVDEIDEAETVGTQDQFQYNILLQSGDLMLLQSGFSIVQEVFGTRALVPFSDNESFETEGRDILDFTSINPFGEF
jgi:hypothetical protein